MDETWLERARDHSDQPYPFGFVPTGVAVAYQRRLEAAYMADQRAIELAALDAYTNEDAFDEPRRWLIERAAA